MRVAALKVGVHRHVGGASELGDVGKHVLARHATICGAARPGKSRAGGGERLEAQALQVAHGADVPGVGNNEASLLVQAPKGSALFGRRWHGVTSSGRDCGGASDARDPTFSPSAWLLTARWGALPALRVDPLGTRNHAGRSYSRARI